MSSPTPLFLLFWVMVSVLNEVDRTPPTVALSRAEGDSLRVEIDTALSLISWKGTEMWQTGKHEGTVQLISGTLVFVDGQFTGGRFIADMQSIKVTDIPKSDPIPRRNLRNHLMSDDFFNVDRYPTAAFAITRILPQANGKMVITGDLSIRDIRKPVSFVAHKDSPQIYQASLTIDRFEWNIAYQGSYWERLTSILDNTLVDADIEISVKLVIRDT